MMLIIRIIFDLLLIYFSLSVLYVLVFALAAKFGRRRNMPQNGVEHSFSIFIPAYKEDKVIFESVASALAQSYDRAKFEVVVIADQMKEQTIEKLREMGATVLIARYEQSTKAKALNLALSEIAPRDMVVVLDADNVVEPDFLRLVNGHFVPNMVALQTHRKAKNMNTPYALLDAVSEEINNSVFRQGHVVLGCSSALIGSGMVFRDGWFRENMPKVTSVGEDKELEFFLLEQGVFVDYREDIPVYDYKVERPDNFYNQRRRWIAAQFSQLSEHLPKLPKAIVGGNIDLMNKIFEQMLLPRVLMIGGIGVLSLLSLLLVGDMAGYWFGLLAWLLFALLISIPGRLFNRDLVRAVAKIPYMAMLMFLNLFRLKGATKKFIHTEK